MRPVNSSSAGFSALVTPASFAIPPRIHADSAWIGHIPFGEWMVSVLRPGQLVELGTHSGASYGAFVDAVQRLQYSTRCYAVDTWTGDSQSGFYGEEVYQELEAFHAPRYSAFSSLLRMTFDEASTHFGEGSIDLLHIDGCHAYEAVKHDFETWLPKLSRSGIVLLHDSGVRREDFGVCRLVGELRQRFPVFEFLHSYGLAVVGTGSEFPDAVSQLFALDPAGGESVRQAYARLGNDLIRQASAGEVAAQIAEARARADEMAKDVERLRFDAEALANAKAELRERDLTEAHTTAETRRAIRDERLRLARAVASAQDRRRSSFRVNRRHARHVRLILESGLFDADWYRRSYPDIGGDDRAVALHYVTSGAFEGRNPNRLFDSSWYLATYPHVAEAGFNPLVDYVRRGAQAGRDPGPGFSSSRYLALNEDVRASGTDALRHYLVYGQSEGREVTGGYDDWIARYDALDDRDRLAFRAAIAGLRLRPLISVIMPVYNTDRRWLERAIDSIRNQLYPHWELCIADDASTDPSVRGVLDRYAALEPKIKLTYRTTNGHISASSNTALELATGEFVALVDADDELAEHALFWVADAINRRPDVDLIYSDEDKISERGTRSDAYFKPDWNPALILSQNVFNHLGVYRRSLVQQVGGFRLGLEGAQDHDLVLRCAEHTTPARIRHIPRVLYHWRAIPGSTASGVGNKPYAWAAGARAISEHLERQTIPGRVLRAEPEYYQVEYEVPSSTDLISVILPSTLDLRLVRPCLDSLLSRTTYPNFEILLVIGSADAKSAEQHAFLERTKTDSRVRVIVREDGPFNYASANNRAVTLAAGSIICFLNDDIEIIVPDWLEIFASRLALPDVGAVGAMLYYPDGRIQHAGVTLGVLKVAGHRFTGMSRKERGYFGLASLEQDLSCVTAACMAVKREAFESLGGFDEHFAVAFNDVDFCIRLRRAGMRIVWTPSVRHYHHESASFGSHDSAERQAVFKHEVALMRELWGDVLDNDPFYNPNLSLDSNRYELAFPPRVAKLPATDR